MIFGIDLGTTNSLIGAGDCLYTDLVSSSVDIVKRESVPKSQSGENIVASYKTNMSSGESGELSVRCSTIVLEQLAKLGTRRSGEEVKDVIISVPAYFSDSQRKAVYKAAKAAGLNLLRVVNEPTAAALYICRNIKDLVVVFDLGGGTFDVSIVDTRMGSYGVLATKGTIIGGDKLDMAIVEDIFATCQIPIFKQATVQAALKVEACKAKELIQKTGTTVNIAVDAYGGKGIYELTVDKYKSLVRSAFGLTFEMTNAVISANLPANEKPKIAFVGGSTMCPYLREMVAKEVGLQEIKYDGNNDYAVAKGVALYAELYEKGEVDLKVDDVTKQLCIEDNYGKSVVIIEANSIVPTEGKIIVSNSERSDKLRLNLYQGDSFVARNNAYIGTLVYCYDEETEAGQGIVEVTVTVAHDGVISLSACDIVTGISQSIELEVK